MSFPTMYYRILIEGADMARTFSAGANIESFNGYNSLEYSTQGVGRVINYSPKSGTGLKLIYSGSVQCRDTMLSSLKSNVLRWLPIVDATFLNTTMRVGINIRKSGVAKYVPMYAKMFAHILDNQISINVLPTHVEIEVDGKAFNAVKMSMLLFIINRSEFFTEELLRNSDRRPLIKVMIDNPEEMFPNNVSSSPGFVVYQGFAMTTGGPLLDNIRYLDPGYGVVNAAMRYSVDNPFIFTEYLNNYGIKNLGSLYKYHGVYYRVSEGGAPITWTQMKRLSKFLYRKLSESAMREELDRG